MLLVKCFIAAVIWLSIIAHQVTYVFTLLARKWCCWLSEATVMIKILPVRAAEGLESRIWKTASFHLNSPIFSIQSWLTTRNTWIFLLLLKKNFESSFSFLLSRNFKSWYTDHGWVKGSQKFNHKWQKLKYFTNFGDAIITRFNLCRSRAEAI